MGGLAVGYQLVIKGIFFYLIPIEPSIKTLVGGFIIYLQWVKLQSQIDAVRHNNNSRSVPQDNDGDCISTYIFNFLFNWVSDDKT
jgi:hypothetical protein